MTVFVFLSSCGNQEEDFIAVKSLSEEEKHELLTNDLKSIVEVEDLIMIDSFPLLAGDVVRQFYKENDYKFHWVNTTDTNHLAALLIGVLDSSWSYGFDPAWYKIPQVKTDLSSIKNSENYVEISKSLARTEVLLSNAYFLLLNSLSQGFIDTASMSVKLKQDTLIENPITYLTSSTENDFVERIFAFQPKLIEYQQLQFALSKWWRANVLWSETFEFPDPKKDSLAYWDVARKALIRNGYLDSISVKTDSLVIEALKKIQADYNLDVDGKPGKQSTWVLKTSNYERFLSAALAMEKWRWKKRGMTMEFRINIPAYELTVHRNDSIIYRARVVTGTQDHETPELTAKVKYFTLYPYWHVPHSISTKEILPYVKRDTAYLYKNNYRIFDLKNNPVAVADVNWKRLSQDYFPYKIRQEGGPGNSLGLIVFFFPNKYDVYLHDTPSKPLFKRNVRAFSHGCMRLQDPFKLGELVWEDQRPKDTVTADTLKAWALRDKENRHHLKKYIPIEVDYITCSGDSLGNIRFHYDVYNRDEKYFKLLRALIK